MAINYVCLFLQRILLPIIIVICAFMRPTGISFAYLLLFFILPFVPIANAKNIKGPVRAYFLTWIALTALILLIHIGLQIALFATDWSNVIPKCSFTEILLRHIGFINLLTLGPMPIIEWIVPEILAFLAALISYLILPKLISKTNEEIQVNVTLEEGRPMSVSTDKSPSQFTKKLRKIGPVFSLLALFLAAVLRPSVPGGLYFIVFLGCSTYWACYQSFQGGFRLILRFLMGFNVLHTIAIFTYQTPWPQQVLSNSTLAARLTGLEPLFISTCENNGDIRQISFNHSAYSDSYLNPIAILICYYVFALTTKTFVPQTETWKTPASKKSKKSEDIALTSLPPPESDERRSTIMQEISLALNNCGEFLYLNSYILTSVIMMVWSIVYHSWLTFVLLIWANILWMIPNQRKTMLRCSPFIVIYAELLLIAQYIYGMDLTDSELPRSVGITAINLAQIGFIKEEKYPCLPLMLKTFFTIMFWITMRQLFKEAKDRKRSAMMADMASPTRIGTGVDVTDNTPPRRHVAFLEKFTEFIRTILVKLWIWILILVIFLCAITGERMTGFRICYMALFLFFVLVFQLSWRSWMRLMYGYWLVLIVYAMSILILIYTYQFDRFNAHWRDYLGISEQMQKDIGLKQYQTKDLFLHLVNPTAIVIMAVFQIHYFHQKFLESLKSAVHVKDLKKVEMNVDDPNEDLIKDTESDGKSEYVSVQDERAPLHKRIPRHIATFAHKVRSVGGGFREFAWTFLEVHLMKIVFIIGFWCCIVDVCLLHVIIAILAIFAIVSSMRIQIFTSRIISILMSILLLAKMIYQVDSVHHKNYDVTCEDNSTTPSRYINNAEWFGFSRMTDSVGLMELLKGYIVFLVMVTLHAIVDFRQTHRRTMLGIANKVPHVIFEDITRKDAETDLKGLFKYILNYGYYKFGLEVSLIALVSVIAYRQDILSILYVMWLCILLSLRRMSCSKLWSSFQVFILLLLILQYLLFVGLPPGLCMEWPWDNSPYLLGLQTWAMIPGPHLYSQTGKLMFDYLLLLCVFRQSRVFSLEKKMSGMNIEHPAGSNKSIVNDIDNLDVTPLDNPVPDFISNARNWLDVLKIGILNGFFWLTLAVVFLAGTNIISLFSIGYLIGSFIFLWQGTDFYLRPIRNILKWWFILIAYNILVIALKTILQICGCLFLDWLKQEACWFVHVFGVSCVATLTGTIPKISSAECTDIKDDTGLTWDAVCFAFLLLQLRIFKSYYFHHIINDTKASSTLASRGAELIEDLREKEIEVRNKREKAVLRKIKEKMEKIKEKQERLSRQLMVKKGGSSAPFARGSVVQRRKTPVTHPEAIRAGDYYMFDDVDEEIELDIESSEIKKIPDATDAVLKDDHEKKDDDQKKSFKTGLMESPGDEDPETKKDDDKSVIAADEPTQQEGLFKRIFNWLLNHINNLSKNYRYVSKILSKEKNVLKESKGFGLGARTGTGNIWTPFKYNRKMQASTSEDLNVPSTSQGHKETEAQTSDTTTDTIEFYTPRAADRLSLADSEEDITISSKNKFVELLIAVWFAFLSNTEILCYIVAIVSQVASATVLSLVIPIMIFLWGTLSIPRPTKTFWITLIAYTQTVVLIKCVFRFKMIWFNDHPEVVTPAKVIGIQSENGNSGFDLLLLLMLFFHRFILKSQGLWKSDYKSDVVDDGAYILLDKPPNPEDLDEMTQKEAKETVLITKNEQTMILARQNPGDSIHEDDTCVHVSNFIEEPGNYLPDVMKVTGSKYCSPIVVFLRDLVRKSRLPTDVYAYMFLCDFINFLVLLFGFSAFDSQREDGGIATYLEDNRVPLSFLLMVILQFVLIIIDRAMYMRKAQKNRLGYHLFLVLGIHIWMFFVIPTIQGRMFNTQAPTVVFYLVKCVYFLLSSYQLRCGYPTRIFGNVFTKGYSLVNMVCFKVYMAIPLLYDLRTVLDWVCTDTTMTLFDWLKMEDIFSEIYCMKCMRQFEANMPVPRGIKKPILVKSFMGGAFIFVFSFLIWGPFVLFAMSSTVGIANTPFDMSISLRIGPYEPVYEMSAQDSNILKFDQAQLEQFRVAYGKNKAALTFLSDYDYQDIAAVTFGTSSASTWDITPPDLQRLIKDLKQNQTLTCRFRYKVARNSSKVSVQKAGPTQGETTFELTPDHPGRESLINMLQMKPVTTPIKLASLLPKFLKVKSGGELKTISQLIPVNVNYRDITIALSQGATQQQSWWNMKEFCGDATYESIFSNLPYAGCDTHIVLYTFSDKVFPSILDNFTSGGIIGMYTTLVLVGWQFIRNFLMGGSRKIIYEELPSVDRVLQLCLDIYLVREALEFTLEEDLYAKLIFLYRSPETMIRWTRPIEGASNDELNDGADDDRSQSSTKKKSE